MHFADGALNDLVARQVEYETGQLDDAVRELAGERGDAICREYGLHPGMTAGDEKRLLLDRFGFGWTVDQGWMPPDRVRREARRLNAVGVVRGALMVVGQSLARRMGARMDPDATIDELLATRQRRQGRGALHAALEALLCGAPGLAGAVGEGRVDPGATAEQDAALLAAWIGFPPTGNDNPEGKALLAALTLIGLRMRQWALAPVATPAAPTARPAAVQLLVRASKLSASAAGPLSPGEAADLLDRATYYRCDDDGGAGGVEQKLALGDGLPEADSEEDVYVRLALPEGGALIGEKSLLGLRSGLAEASAVRLCRACRLCEPVSADVLDQFEVI